MEPWDTFFCLLNPNCKLPYLIEGKSAAVKYERWLAFVKQKISQGIKPVHDPEYDALRALEWANIKEVYDGCLKKKAADRATLNEIKETLSHVVSAESYPLNVHQGTAVIEAQEKHLFSGTSFSKPENDGTNSCVFLSLKIAEALLLVTDRDFVERKAEVEKIITKFPKKFNSVRDITICC